MARTYANQFHQCVTYVKLETVVIILKTWLVIDFRDSDVASL